jgi:TPR repeat protein
MSEDEPDWALLHHFHGMLPTDPKAAIEGLKALADRGSSWSMALLVEAYAKGQIVETDISQAEEWNRRAMAAGRINGSYEIGRYYIDVKDYDMARKAFLMGVEQNFAPSLNMLAIMYMNGWGGPKNLQGARDLLERAVVQRHIYAKRTLARLLMKGTFGIWQRLRGPFLLLSGVIDYFFIIERRPHSDRLR